jgi:DNA-binding GntR family transcriptional regulator
MASPAPRRLPPVAPPANLPDLAYGALRDAIVRGRFDFGEPLRQEELAAELGISRLPLREALRRLEAEGLVVMRPRRGYVVAEFSRAEIDEVFAIRALLEAEAGRRATERRGGAETKALKALLRQLEEAGAAKPLDAEAFARANSAFHDFFVDLGGGPLLARMLRVLRAAAERYTRLSVSLATEIEASQSEHRAIVRAFAAGDAESVGLLLEAHCRNTARRLLAHLPERETP